MTYFKRSLFVAVFFLFSLTAIADNSADIKALVTTYHDWCDAIGNAKGDPAVVVKYYAPGAILLPTLSPKILINTQGGLDAYFTKFTSHTNIKCIPEKLITRVYDENIGMNTGLYAFTYIENGKTETVKARFSFFYKKNSNQWLIINHHSSKLPL